MKEFTTVSELRDALENPEYKITWAPTQAELELCEAELIMYFVLLREHLSAVEFLAKFNMKPSNWCMVYYVPAAVSVPAAEAWVKMMLETVSENQTLWCPEVGLVMGKPGLPN